MELLTSTQAAKYLGCAHPTLLNWSRDGHIAPAKKIATGRMHPTFMWSRADLDQLMKTEFYSERRKLFWGKKEIHAPKAEKKVTTVTKLDKLKEIFSALQAQDDLISDMEAKIALARDKKEKMEASLLGKIGI